MALPKWTDLDNVRNTITSTQETTVNEIETLKGRIDSVTARFDSNHESQGVNQIIKIENELKILQHNMSLMKKNVPAVAESSTEREQFNITYSNGNTNNSNNNNNNNNDNNDVSNSIKGNTENITTPSEVKLVICIDSNGKHLDHRKFWTLRGTVWKKCYVIGDVRRVFDTYRQST